MNGIFHVQQMESWRYQEKIVYLISEFNIVKELKPAIKTEFGYKTNKNIKRLDSSEKTQDNIIAQFLLKKSSQCRRRRNKVLEYNLTLEYIKELLLKQEYKDYYTGQVPENYEDYSIDSNLGYIEGNIVITTNRVNTMKNDTEEFKKLISDIYKNISNF